MALDADRGGGGGGHGGSGASSQELGKAVAAPAATNAAPAADDLQGLIASGYGKIDARKWADAAEALEGARKLAPSNEVVRFGLSTAYIKLNRFKDALAILDGLLKDFPDNPSVKNNIAWILAKSGDPAVRNLPKAIAYAQEALLAAPRDYNVWGTLAEAYLAVGRPERAVRVAKAAWQLSLAAGEPDGKEFLDLYQRCRVAAGERDPGETGERGAAEDGRAGTKRAE